MYGGTHQGLPDANLVLAISATKIWSRTGPTRDARPRTNRNNWGLCSALVVNPIGYFLAALACERDIWLSFDFGSTWTLSTKNLPVLMGAKPGSITTTFPKTVLIVSLDSLNKDKLVLCGTYNGVYVLGVDEFNGITEWTRFGTTADLPLVPVRHLFYQRTQDVLYAFTFGRGTYTLPGALAIMQRYKKTTAAPPACPNPRSRPNAFISAYYTAFPIPATPVRLRHQRGRVECRFTSLLAFFAPLLIVSLSARHSLPLHQRFSPPIYSCRHFSLSCLILFFEHAQPPPTRSANQFAVQTTVRLLLELSQTNAAVAASLRAGIEYALGIVGQARVVWARRFESRSQTRQEKENF